MKDMTIAELLAKWDNGDIVWTVEMGGLGPGYEQAIHVMAFEMLRYIQGHPIDFSREDEKYWRDYVDGMDASPEMKATYERIGPSGAQVGAARNIATVFVKQGYAKGMEMIDKDRHIQVSKTFPAEAA